MRKQGKRFKFYVRAVASLLSMALFSPMMVMASDQSHSVGSKKTYSGPHAHWGYSGAEGPKNWGRLSSAYGECSAGKNQSPIDIRNSSFYELDELQFDYQQFVLEIVNNGHTIQVNNTGYGNLQIAGESYDFLQLHFHTPSEHMINGRHAPLEMHLVHKSKSGRLAVLGVMIEEGDENVELEKVWFNMPEIASEKVKMNTVSFEPRNVLPESRDYFHYNGSLTTPPCSEGVRWFVFNQPIQMSSFQIDKFMRVVGENARPVQSLFARSVRSSR